jgi:hypothetical protein
MQSATHQPLNPNAVIVVCGVAKMFVGDLIETGTTTPLLLISSKPIWLAFWVYRCKDTRTTSTDFK